MSSANSEQARIEQLTDALRIAKGALDWCAGHLETCQGGPPSPPPFHVQNACEVARHALRDAT